MRIFKKYREAKRDRKMLEKYQVLAMYEHIIKANEAAQLYEVCVPLNHRKNIIIKDIQNLLKEQ